MRQQTEGMVGSTVQILLEIYFSFKLWKNFENDKVITMNSVYYFFWT